MWVIQFLAIKTHANARLPIHTFCLVIIHVPFRFWVSTLETLSSVIANNKDTVWSAPLFSAFRKV